MISSLRALPFIRFRTGSISVTDGCLWDAKPNAIALPILPVDPVSIATIEEDRDEVGASTVAHRAGYVTKKS